MKSALSLLLPCPRCGAGAGDPCVRRDGGPLKGIHAGRNSLSPCGTYAAYQRHVRDGEAACEPCKDAQRRYMQAYRERRPDVRAKDIAGLRARNAAVKLLVERHRDEFRALLTEVSA